MIASSQIGQGTKKLVQPTDFEFSTRAKENEEVTRTTDLNFEKKNSNNFLRADIKGEFGSMYCPIGGIIQKKKKDQNITHYVFNHIFIY